MRTSFVKESRSSPRNTELRPMVASGSRQNWLIGEGILSISSRHMNQNQKFELANSSSGQAVILPIDNNTNSEVSLESMFSKSITNQQVSFEYPIIACSQFNLNSSMCTNFAMRFSKNIHSRRLNQRLAHSRFCPTHNFHTNYKNKYFECCEFLSLNRVAVGTKKGEIKVFNLFTSREELSFSTQNDSSIIHMQCSNDKRLFITSANWLSPLTSIWSICEDAINIKYSLDHEKYCTFSNYDQNKILGTKAEIATIYDLETSKKILTLVPRRSNGCFINQAAFNATNKLVLSDGVLWDAIAGKEIHKFDGLNQCANGIFHPNGLEIISDEEVWDIRTFQLLRTVSSLDRCKVIFSKSGEGMYYYALYHSENVFCTQTWFKTLDPNDYSDIATVEVQYPIYHIACNSDDTQIATIENTDKSIVRIYDVGRSINKNEVRGMSADKKNDNISSGSNCNSSFKIVGESSR